jgi:hypothetical protein
VLRCFFYLFPTSEFVGLEEPDQVREDIGGISFYFYSCELGGIGSDVAGLGFFFFFSL